MLKLYLKVKNIVRTLGGSNLYLRSKKKKDNQRYLITKYGMIMLYRLIKEQITFRYSVRR